MPEKTQGATAVFVDLAEATQASQDFHSLTDAQQRAAEVTLRSADVIAYVTARTIKAHRDGGSLRVWTYAGGKVMSSALLWDNGKAERE